MLDGKKLFRLYIRIFIIIFFVGLIFPYIIEYILSLIHLINERNHSGNSIFVFNQNGAVKNFMYYFMGLLEKLIDFS